MGATVRCPVQFCQAWVPLNADEERRLSELPDDETTAEILCIACGVHSAHLRQDLIVAQIERFYSARARSAAFGMLPATV
jgi:hypothetical protein